MKDPDNLTMEQFEMLLKLTKDEVSGVYNRKVIMSKIEEYLKKPEKEGDFALLMIDIDDFKKINDEFGHQCGDSTLYHVAQTIKSCFKNNSIVGRIGGDEFFCFLWNINLLEVKSKLDMLLNQVRILITKDDIQKYVSISIGVVVINKNEAITLNELYEKVDDALYKAKSLGKDQYYFFTDDGGMLNKTENKGGKVFSLGLQELLNKLEIGIAVFHSTNQNEFIPIFCNNGYLGFFDISFYDFTQKATKRNNYGLHPDDIERVRKKVLLAIKGNKKVHETVRIMTNNDSYRWVTMNGNIIELSDGGFDFYIIFTNAEEEVQDRQIVLERYKNLIGSAYKQAQFALSAFHFNITKGSCKKLWLSLAAKKEVNCDSFESFMKSCASNISYKKNKDEFLKVFSKDNLLSSFEKGILTIEKNIPITLSDDSIIWCKQYASLTRNPISKDIECVVTLLKQDKEIRMKEYLNRIVEEDYDFVGCINIKTKSLIVMREARGVISSFNDGDTIPYLASMEQSIDTLVQKDFVSECKNSLKIEKIISELQNEDIYIVTYPAIKDIIGHDGAFQWKIGYANESKKELLITRKETFRFLDKRQIINKDDDKNYVKNQKISLSIEKGNRQRNKILVADDVDINRELLKIIFENEYEVIEAKDGEEAISLIDEYYDKLAIILLDMKMPKKTGLDVLIHNKMRGYNDKIPVIIITGSTNDQTNLSSFKYGAADIISKPFDSEIVRRRALNLIELYAHKEDVEMQLDKWKKDALKLHKIAEKNNEVLVDILSSVVEFRSYESGTHIKRVRRFTEVMLKTWITLYGEDTFEMADIDQISRASTMHDIGKVAIPDSILQKPGKLTSDEFEIMKKHTILGCEMLKQIEDEDSKLYKYCYDICRYHHEREDGRGYPDGLKGNEIPVWAQIVAIVDVFDALTTPRVYKGPYPTNVALEMIKNGECGTFSKDLIKCFEASFNLILSIINE